MPPKSILKKPAGDVNPPSGRPNVDPRHLQVALHHANILEYRKQVEAQVLDSIMTLMDYPTAADADPKRPSPADAQFFREAVVPFQPADYDSLIEERNITDKCGYALCPRPKARAPSTARKHFVETADGVEIVDRKLLEVWCSDDCARRALYVKVQLNEEPSWLRQGGYSDKIELMVDNADEHHTTLPLRLKNEAPVATEEEDDVASAWAAREDAMTDLAVERGETPGQLSKANKDLIQDQITERATTSDPPQPPALASQTSEHTMAIEGHVPRANRKDKDEDEEDDAQDWDKALPG